MTTLESLSKTKLGGRRFNRRQLAEIVEATKTFGALSRKELALTLCEHLRWRTPGGSLKIQSCLSMLETLEEHGHVTLPAKRVTKKPVRRAPRFEEEPAWPPVQGELSSVQPISLKLVSTPEERERWKAYLESYHYLGYRQPVGDYLAYLIVSEPLQQELGCLVFSGSAVWA